MGQSETPSTPKARAEKDTARRQPYSPPRLRSYGDVRQITRTLNSLMGAADGMVIGPMILKTGGF